MPYKANEARRHKIPRASYKVTNWPEYDRALQQRGSLTVWVTPEALAAWHTPHTGGRGRPRDYSDVAIETGHLLRLAFGRPWRQTEGLLRSITVLLGLNVSVPDHTTFSRRSPGLVVATALAQAQANGPVHVVIDATGLMVFGAGEWLVEKHGERGTRTWRKLHLAVNPISGEILASELTSNDEGDASQVGPCSGPSQDWGSGCDRHRWVWIVGWMELLSEAGTERAIIDGAPNLEQQVGPASRPAHLL